MMFGEITINHFLVLSGIIFVIGLFGIFLNRRNIITILMAIELILLSVSINFIAFAAYLGDDAGRIFTLFILTVAAAESAVGLSVLVVYFRNRGTIDVESVNRLQG